MEKIKFNLIGEEEAAEFFILEQTQLGGQSYLLVTDQEDGDADCWILRLSSDSENEEAVYEMVEDEQELEAVGSLFASLMDDETSLLYSQDA